MNKWTQYIRQMLAEFEIPGSDALIECHLALPGQVWDSAIFISTDRRRLYRDKFHFWVRTFFCFVECRDGKLFRGVIPIVDCRDLSAQEFKRDYLGLLRRRMPDSHFAECQKFVATRTELKQRSFANPHVIVNRPNFKSAVANSDGEYLAYFVAPTSGRRFRLLQ